MTKPTAWLEVVPFAALLFALYMNWSWPWGLLLLYWAVSSCLSGETHLISRITRDQTPSLFYAVVILWFGLGALLLLADASPGLVDDLPASPWKLP